MKKFFTITSALLLLAAGLMSCTRNPKLETATIDTDEQIYIEEGKTYELILTGTTSGEPCVLLTDCTDKKVLSAEVSKWERIDGGYKTPLEYEHEWKVVFNCETLTKDKYQIIPALMTVADTLEIGRAHV